MPMQSLMGHKKSSTITREQYIKPQDDSATTNRDPAQLDSWNGNGRGNFPCNSLNKW